MSKWKQIYWLNISRIIKCRYILFPFQFVLKQVSCMKSEFCRNTENWVFLLCLGLWKSHKSCQGKAFNATCDTPQNHQAEQRGFEEWKQPAALQQQGCKGRLISPSPRKSFFFFLQAQGPLMPYLKAIKLLKAFLRILCDDISSACSISKRRKETGLEWGEKNKTKTN